jgi:hypothetical protein
MVPHFGLQFHKSSRRRKIFHAYLLADAILLSFVIGYLLVAGAGWLALACVFLAGCPDFVQAYKYLFKPDFRIMPSQHHWFTKFHKSIQWSETPKGLLVEIPLAAVMFALITSLI